MGAQVHDGQSSEPFYRTFKNLTILFFKVIFRVVENLLVASHEVSQIKTLHALVNTYDIWRRAQLLLDYWRELPSSQNPDCWESTRYNTYTYNSLKSRFCQPPCDPRYLRELDERENQSLDVSLDYGQRPWGISRGVTDQQSTHFHSN